MHFYKFTENIYCRIKTENSQWDCSKSLQVHRRDQITSQACFLFTGKRNMEGGKNSGDKNNLFNDGN